jgi:hypothetical protein
VLGKSGHIWEAHIKRNVQVVGCLDMEYVHLSENNVHLWGLWT